MELIAAGSYSSIRSLFSSSESVSVATSCSSSLTSASGLRSSLYYKTIQTEMASSLDPLSCDASKPDAIGPHFNYDIFVCVYNTKTRVE